MPYNLDHTPQPVWTRNQQVCHPISRFPPQGRTLSTESPAQNIKLDPHGEESKVRGKLFYTGCPENGCGDGLPGTVPYIVACDRKTRATMEVALFGQKKSDGRGSLTEEV